MATPQTAQSVCVVIGFVGGEVWVVALAIACWAATPTYLSLIN